MEKVPEILMEHPHAHRQMVVDFPRGAGKEKVAPKKSSRHSDTWKWEPEFVLNFDKKGNRVPSYAERKFLPLTKDVSHKKFKRLKRAERNGGNMRAILNRVG